jgi:histone H3/H4
MEGGRAVTFPKPPRRGRKAPKRIGRRKGNKYGTRAWNLKMPRSCSRSKALDIQALALFSRVVRMRDSVCKRCSVRWSKEAHHLIPRSVRRFRYDVTNGAGLCWYCHKKVTEDGDENRALAMSLLGEYEWVRRQCLKGPCKVDPAMAILILKAERDELLRRGVQDVK